MKTSHTTKTLCLFALGVFVVAFQARPARPAGVSEPSPVRAVVLGIAQDGGVPHIGCRQPVCVSARRDPAGRQRGACLGLIDGSSGQRFLIDATPDLASQVDSLNEGRALANPKRPVDGVLLTHAHIGHYTGLVYLGREALGADHVPVFSTPRMAAFLRGNEPWKQLVAQGHIEIREVLPGHEVAMGRFRVTAVPVPHRDEISDTVGFRVRGPARSLLYVPDIDKWERWDRNLAEEVAGVDVALLDGTFEDAAELPGRRVADVPHPLVGETMALLSAPALRGRVHFTHLNHTNRLLWDAEAVRRAQVRGFRVARDGDAFPL